MEIEQGRNRARIVIVDGREAVEIELTQGHTALVDVEDWPKVASIRWWAHGTEPWVYARGWAQREGDSGKREMIQMHRVVLAAHETMLVDHKESTRTLDNRRANLRLATKPNNGANRRPQAGGTSRYKGVSWNTERGCWRAAIYRSGRTILVGYFDSEEEAAAAYDRRARALDGEFARTNFFYTRALPIWPERHAG